MKKNRVLWALGILLTAGLPAAVGAGAETAPDPDLIVRVQFAGTAALKDEPAAETFRNVWAYPGLSRDEGRNIFATPELWGRLLDKAARAPQKLFRQRQGDQSALVRPMLEDWLTRESFAELRGQGEEPPQFVLGVRLPDERARLWETNLWQMLGAWGVESPRRQSMGGVDVWEFEGPGAGLRWRLGRTGEWTILGVGHSRSGRYEALLAGTRKSGHPVTQRTDHWLSIDLNWQRITNTLPIDWPANVSYVGLRMKGEGDNLRTEGRLIAFRSVRWDPAPWTPPTDTIRDPLISFNASRQLDHWLGLPKGLRELPVNPLKGQLFGWALSIAPLQSFAAIPVPDAKSAFERNADELMERYNPVLSSNRWGELVRSTNRTELYWRGMPFVAPTLRPLKEAAGEYLVAGLFAQFPATNVPPAALFDQFRGRDEVVYYGWEITQERIKHWSQLDSLLPLLETVKRGPDPETIARLREQRKAQKASVPPTARGNPASASKPPDASTRADKENASARPARDWLVGISSLLGNTITELTVDSPEELRLVRRSPVGATGFELVMLSRWLDDEEFPLCGYQLPVSGGGVSGQDGSK